MDRLSKRDVELPFLWSGTLTDTNPWLMAAIYLMPIGSPGVRCAPSMRAQERVKCLEFTLNCRHRNLCLSSDSSKFLRFLQHLFQAL